MILTSMRARRRGSCATGGDRKRRDPARLKEPRPCISSPRRSSWAEGFERGRWSTATRNWPHIFFEIVEGGGPRVRTMSPDNSRPGARGRHLVTGPSTPGQYQVVVKDQQFNVVASATLTVTGANPGPSPSTSATRRSPRPEPASGRMGATSSCRPRRKAGRATTSSSAPPVTTSWSGAQGTMWSAVSAATTSSSAGPATTIWTVGRTSTR